MNVLPGSKVSSCDEQIKLRALLDRVSLKKKKLKKKYFWAQNFQFILAVQIKVVQLTKICEKKKTNGRDVFRTVQPRYTIIMPQTKSSTKEILLSCNQNSFVTSVNKQCSPKVCFGEVFHIKCIIIKWSHM